VCRDAAGPRIAAVHCRWLRRESAILSLADCHARTLIAFSRTSRRPPPPPALAAHAQVMDDGGASRFNLPACSSSPRPLPAAGAARAAAIVKYGKQEMRSNAKLAMPHYNASNGMRVS